MAKKRAKKKIEEAMESSESCCMSSKMKGCSGGAYCLATIGALVYHLSTATGFWDGVWGIVQAILWPAFLVFNLMKNLAM